MHFLWPMTVTVLFILFFDNGNVKGNTLEIQVSQMLQEMIDLKEHLKFLQKGLAQEKVIRINLGKKIDSMEETWGQNLAALATTIDNIDRHIENRLLAKINANDVTFGTKLEEKISTTEQKFEESIRNTEQSIENKLIAKLNCTEVAFQTKLEEMVNTTEQKFNESIGNTEKHIENRLFAKINGSEVDFDIKLEEKVSTIEKKFKESIQTSENKLIARINVTEVTFGIILREQVNTTEQKFKGSMSTLNQTFGNLNERVNQWRIEQQGHTHTTLPYCEHGWEEYQSSCYYFENSNDRGKSWIDAQGYCSLKNSKLLRLDNQMEFQFIQGVLKELHQKQLKAGITPLCGYWTGANDIMTEGRWMWSPRDMPMRYTVWADREPNYQHAGEDCGELSRYHDFKMNDLSCWPELYFICEKLIG